MAIRSIPMKPEKTMMAGTGDEMYYGAKSFYKMI
jgi:hypothetical protein